MLANQKLKGPIGRIYPITIFSALIVVIAEILIRKSLAADGANTQLLPIFTVFAVGLFFMAMGIYQLKRYKLWVNFGIGLLFGIGCWMSIAHYAFSFITIEMYIAVIIVNVIFIIVNWNVLYTQERLDVNARRLFKLSVDQIDETSNGFTNRPFSGGKLAFSPEELKGFMRFLEGNYIGKTFRQREMTSLVFSLGISPLKVSQPDEASHVSIGTNGELSVSISKYDYHQYRKTYSFDLICASMTDAFARFLDYYKTGNESRIITELKST